VISVIHLFTKFYSVWYIFNLTDIMIRSPCDYTSLMLQLRITLLLFILLSVLVKYWYFIHNTRFVDNTKLLLRTTIKDVQLLVAHELLIRWNTKLLPIINLQAAVLQLTDYRYIGVKLVVNVDTYSWVLTSSASS